MISGIVLNILEQDKGGFIMYANVMTGVRNHDKMAFQRIKLNKCTPRSGSGLWWLESYDKTPTIIIKQGCFNSNNQWIINQNILIS